MSIYMKITEDGKIKISTNPGKVRLKDLDKWLGRNRDAVLVKLDGQPGPSARYKVGHICSIEEDEEDQDYNVFVGKNYLGKLPAKAVEFAEQVDSSPEYLISIVGKIEHDDSTDKDVVYIYIAE